MNPYYEPQETVVSSSINASDVYAQSTSWKKIFGLKVKCSGKKLIIVAICAITNYFRLVDSNGMISPKPNTQNKYEQAHFILGAYETVASYHIVSTVSDFVEVEVLPTTGSVLINRVTPTNMRNGSHFVSSMTVI